ncbi:hypothetical protein E4T56_gene18126 [Termitomyces sp. T112]|nr:hypothetical protein E4T56_gene18126 [Termitomyces sp. T112]
MATPLASDTSATSSPPDSTPAPAAKPADIGKAPEHTVAKEQPPIAKEPVAQPPIHPFSGIPSRYAAPPPLTGILLLPTELTMTDPALAYLYTTASNISNLSLPPHAYLVSTDTYNPLILGQTLPLDTYVTDTTPTYVNILFPAQYVANEPPKRKGVQVKKKYKPVAMKTKPVTSHISEDFPIECQIIGNPLATLPPLNPNLPPFVLTKRFTGER